MQPRPLTPWLLAGAATAMLVSACQATVQGQPEVAPPAQPRPAAVSVKPPSYEAAITAIAEDIERLKNQYPQLADFSSRKHCSRESLVISYSYRTHRSQRRGGWTSGVPNPDADGIWFHIDFHDPDSTDQIHTQPVVRDMRYREKKVMVLILEGKRTRRVAPALMTVLRRRGVTTPGGFDRP